MSRAEAILETQRYFDGGGFVADLARRIAIKSESQNPARRAELSAYLEAEMRPYLEGLGFRCNVLANPSGNAISRRMAGKSSPESTSVPSRS